MDSRGKNLRIPDAARPARPADGGSGPTVAPTLSAAAASLSRAASSLRLVDRCCVAYLLVTAAIAVFGRGLEDRMSRIGWNAVWIAAITLLVALHLRYRRFAPLAWLRTLYPVAVIAFAWRELDGAVPFLFGRYWATGWLVGMDQAIFGVHPTVWVQRFYGGALDEVMNVFYAGYYFLMPAICLTFLLKKRRRQLLIVLSVAAFTYLLNDLLYYLIPAVSPRLVPEIVDARARDYAGYLFASITRAAQAGGSVRGACFPSSHVSGGIVWCLAVRLFDRKLSTAILPIAAGVPLATVYLGYHHAVDAMAGVLIGFTGFRVALWLLRRRGELPRLAAASRALPVTPSHGACRSARDRDRSGGEAASRPAVR